MLPSRSKITYVSGTRADFGLMRHALLAIHADGAFDLSIAACGMHFDATRGRTVDEIRASGLRIACEVARAGGERTPLVACAVFAEEVQAFAQAWSAERPDLVLLLGDRTEMLAAAIAAAQLDITTAHLHGGERSGTLDERTRHAITKYSNVHWPATQQSAARIQRMGERADCVRVVGAPGLQGLLESAQSGNDALQSDLGQAFRASSPTANQPFILACLHPESSDEHHARNGAQLLRGVLEAVGLPVIWMRTNTDPGSAGIEAVRLSMQSEQPMHSGQIAWITHWPRDVFCAAMARCAVMVGNSSAGIIEAASFGTRVLNIGTRQRLREHGDNVQHLVWDAGDLARALRVALTEHAGSGALSCQNPYGDGHCTEKILAELHAWQQGDRPMWFADKVHVDG